MSGSHGNELIL